MTTELATALDAVVSAELSAEIDNGLPAVNSYLVSDPWAEELLRPALTGWLAESDTADTAGWLAEGGSWPGGIASGPNPAALLAALAGLAVGGTIRVVNEGSAELFHAATLLGIPMHDGAAAGPVALVQLRRPWALPHRAEVEALARQVAPLPVLVDESDLDLCRASDSAAALTGVVDNLIVVRRLPGIGRLAEQGGAFCLSSAALTAWLQATVPPLFGTPLALRVTRAVLARLDLVGAGAPAERAREHRRQANLALVRRLTAAGADPGQPAQDAPAVRTDQAGAELAASWGWPVEPDRSFCPATGQLVERFRLPT